MRVSRYVYLESPYDDLVFPLKNKELRVGFVAKLNDDRRMWGNSCAYLPMSIPVQSAKCHV